MRFILSRKIYLAYQSSLWNYRKRPSGFTGAAGSSVGATEFLCHHLPLMRRLVGVSLGVTPPPERLLISRRPCPVVLEALRKIRIRDKERAETSKVCDNFGVAAVLHP